MKSFPFNKIQIIYLALIAYAVVPVAKAAERVPAEDIVAQNAGRISQEILDHNFTYRHLKELLKIGPRLGGSPNAARAVEWGRKKMLSLSADRVFLQPVSVPHWERGKKESAIIVGAGKSQKLKIAALGTSVGTNGKTLEAEVIELDDLASAAKAGPALAGKIVFFNHAMNPNSARPFAEYSQSVGIRYQAAAIGAKYGAVAAIIRSLSTLPDDDHPHTGIMAYEADVAKIPGAALSTHAANVLSQQLKSHPKLRLRLTLSAQNFEAVQSYNVVGEWRGSALPEEYVVVGGHLDSWDLSPGAHDDGAGVAQSLETLRALSSLGIRPKRTVRCVLFMSEEFGVYGAKEYLRLAKLNNEKHIGAIESDSGGFQPVGISAAAKGARTLSRVQSWLPYFEKIGPLRVVQEGSGADVGGLAEIGAETFELKPDPTHYFDFHHSALDTIDKIKPAEIRAGAATMAVMTYLMAELGF